MSSDCEMQWNDDCEMYDIHELYDPRELYGDDIFVDSVNDNDSNSDSEINDEEYTLTVTFKVTNKTMINVYNRTLQLRDELFNDGQLNDKQITYTVKKA